MVSRWLESRSVYHINRYSQQRRGASDSSVPQAFIDTRSYVHACFAFDPSILSLFSRYTSSRYLTGLPTAVRSPSKKKTRLTCNSVFRPPSSSLQGSSPFFFLFRKRMKISFAPSTTQIVRGGLTFTLMVGALSPLAARYQVRRYAPMSYDAF